MKAGFSPHVCNALDCLGKWLFGNFNPLLLWWSAAMEVSKPKSLSRARIRNKRIITQIATRNLGIQGAI